MSQDILGQPSIQWDTSDLGLGGGCQSQGHRTSKHPMGHVRPGTWWWVPKPGTQDVPGHPRSSPHVMGHVRAGI